MVEVYTVFCYSLLWLDAVVKDSAFLALEC